MGVIKEAQQGVSSTVLLETKSSSNFALSQNTTLQLVFDASIINTSDDAVMINAAGATTVNKTDSLEFILIINGVKTASPGNTHLYIKILVDGAQVGQTIHEEFNSDEEGQTITQPFNLLLNASEVVTFEIVADNGDIELRREDPTAITGWTVIAESQHLIINRLS